MSGDTMKIIQNIAFQESSRDISVNDKVACYSSVTRIIRYDSAKCKTHDDEAMAYKIEM
jgi:hypothetical protein